MPLLSLLVLLPRFPVLVTGFCAVWLLACRYYINRYALRNSPRSVLYLRLHRDTAMVTYKNRETASLKITAICMTRRWILLRLGRQKEKIILDGASIGASAYASLARQVRAFKQSGLEDQPY